MTLVCGIRWLLLDGRIAGRRVNLVNVLNRLVLLQ